MICFDRSQCRAWVIRHLSTSVRFDDEWGLPDLDQLGFARDRFQHPADSGTKVALARDLWQSVSAGSAETLIYMQNCHIWPSSGHIPLLLRLRMSYGEGRDVDTAPGHAIDVTGDPDSGISLLVLAIEFFWDCLVLPDSGKRALYLSHDEFFDFYAMDPGDIDKLKGLIGKIVA